MASPVALFFSVLQVRNTSAVKFWREPPAQQLTTTSTTTSTAFSTAVSTMNRFFFQSIIVCLFLLSFFSINDLDFFD